jgi:hypothetical protein
MLINGGGRGLQVGRMGGHGGLGAAVRLREAGNDAGSGA